jgi:endonuclease-3
VTVDTHVRRLAQRLGLTVLEDPEKIAAELEDLIPRDKWIRFSTRLILHGRRVCKARSPRCGECVLRSRCPRVGLSKRKPDLQ